MAKEIKKKDTIKKVEKKKKEKKKTTKEGFFKGLRKELKQVKWPSFKDIVKYTLATIIFCIVFVAFFMLLNALMAYVKGLFN